MRPALRLGLRLALGSAREQRLRAASVLVAVLIGTVILLGVAAVARSEQVQQPGTFDNVDNRRLLAAVVTAILVPVLVLVATVGRLSAGLRERRMANLRLLGMGSAQARLVAAVEAGAGAVAGALLGIPAFLLARPVLASVHVAGHHWPTSTLWPPVWAYPAVVVLLPGVVIGLAAIPARLRPGAALALARRAEERRPHWWRVLPALVGAVLCGVVMVRMDPTEGSQNALIGVMFAGITLLGVGLIVAVPVFVRLCADLMLRVARGPATIVAARRLQVQPAGVNRVISGLLIGLFVVIGARTVVVAFESMDQYQLAAAQLDTGQTAVVEVGARHVGDQVGRARRTPGVDQVATFAKARTSCGMNGGSCLNVLVAGCEDLHVVVPALQGCRDDRAWSLWRDGLHAGKTVRLHARGAETTIRLPRHLGHATGAGVLGLVVDLVLPPDTPGLAALTEHSHRMIVVSAPAGRWLDHRLHAHGVFTDGGPDFDYYDYVGQLRALVWAVAAVILSIGLLSFAIAALDRAVSRRREVASLQVIGVPRSLLRRTQWIESALPLGLGGVLAVGLGLLGGATFLTIDSGSLAPPWGQALVLSGIAAVGAVVVGGLTVLASSPPLSPDLIRQE